MIRLTGIVNSFRQLNEQPIAPETMGDAPQVPQKPAEDQLDVEYFVSQVDTLVETIGELDRELTGRLETLSNEFDEYRGNTYMKLNGSASRYLKAVQTNLEGLSEAIQKLEQ